MVESSGKRRKLTELNCWLTWSWPLKPRRGEVGPFISCYLKISAVHWNLPDRLTFNVDWRGVVSCRWVHIGNHQDTKRATQQRTFRFALWQLWVCGGINPSNGAQNRRWLQSSSKSLRPIWALQRKSHDDQKADLAGGVGERPKEGVWLPYVTITCYSTSLFSALFFPSPIFWAGSGRSKGYWALLPELFCRNIVRP